MLRRRTVTWLTCYLLSQNLMAVSIFFWQLACLRLIRLSTWMPKQHTVGIHLNSLRRLFFFLHRRKIEHVSGRLYFFRGKMLIQLQQGYTVWSRLPNYQPALITQPWSLSGSVHGENIASGPSATPHRSTLTVQYSTWDYGLWNIFSICKYPTTLP